MVVTKKIEGKPVIGSPGHSTDEKRQQVGTFLRNADKSIKEGRLDQARAELKKVRELEPNNAYALAFEERIASIESQAIKEKTSPVPPPEQAPAKAPVAAPAKPAEDKAPPPQPPPIEKPVAEVTPKVEAPAPPVIDETVLAEERAKLEAELKKQQSAFEEQAENAFQRKLQEEIQKVEARYREELANEQQRLEKEITEKLEAQHTSRLQELQKSMEVERITLAEKERQSVTLLKAQLEAEFARKLTTELDSFKKTSTTEEKQLRAKLEETLRGQLQKESEMQVAQQRASMEAEFKKREKEIDQSYKDQHNLFLKESERKIEEKIKEMRAREAEKFEQKRLETQKSLELEYQSKLQKTLAEEQKKFDERSKKAEAERAALEQERKRLADTQAQLARAQENLKAEMERNTAQLVEHAKQEVADAYERKMELLGIGIPKTKEEKTKLYYDRIREAWASGALTMEKAQGLMELQELLGMSFEEHAACESNVRLQLYADAVEQAILSGKVKASDTQTLDEMKRRYDITVEEAANLESLILSAFQRSATKAIILIADDDVDLTAAIKDRLRELGYSVIVHDSIAGALEFLGQSPVDLILSDLRFQGEKMDGFTFFKEIQKTPKLRKIPFILMTSMDEGLFMRTGVQLGIDDYLTKPLDLELLVAVIEGKLKKYRSLRES